MKQFYLKTLLLCLFTLAGTTAHAYYDALIDGIYYFFSRTEKTAEVTNPPSYGTAYSGAVVIPSTVTYKKTTYSVTSIGNYAFYGCSGLTSITIPNGVTTIGEYAFRGCSGLETIIVEKGNTFYDSRDNCNAIIKTADNLLIAGCKSTVIPESVTNIGSSAFYGCSGLTSITIPNSVTTIGDYAFSGCSGLTSVTIPNSVTSISSYAFYGCSGLTSITIPNSVTEIGSSAFRGCSGLTSITIPESVTSIREYAFQNCSGLTSITIPESVTSIREYAFQNCSGLTSITIPESVTTIGDCAFYGCSGLKSITIPNSVTNIGSSAFQNCSGLTSITIPNSVTTIGSSAFSGCSGLTSITIPESVTYIGDCAFYGCSGLKSITIPNSVTTIGSSAFSGCSGLTSITIPNSVTTIYGSAFKGCSGLTSITIGNSVTDIRSDAFEGCSNLSTLTLNCKSIGSWFSGIKSLNTITLNDSVTTISWSAFEGCSGLTSITIPNSVTEIGSGAFRNCSGLMSITIPESVTSIGSDAFSGCDKAKIFTNRGTTSLLALWYINVEPYETGTDKLLPKPTVKQISSTQTTITVELENCYDEYDYKIGDKIITNKKQPTVIAGLKPGDSYSNLKVLSGNSSCYLELKSKLSTQNINPSIQSKQVTASSVLLKASYSEGDSKVVGQYFMVGKDKINGNNASIAGLDPNTSFTAKYVVEIKYGDKEQYTTTYSSNEQTIMTSTLTLTTLQPKVATPGNVIVAAESNLDDAETNVGFEWRRTDWTDDFSSNTGGAFLYEGNMEGYIRNLNTDKLWKYRPYYESNSGKRYYGEWMGLDPTNTSFFEPTVHTYANVSVQGNQAEVKGYAMRGSDNVASQGFFYWQQPAGARAEAPGGVSVPKNAMKAEANGNIMTTTLEGLDYLTTYCYVAFMTTSEGDTFYGELRTFETGEDTSGIEDIPSATKTAAGTQKVYDLNGRRIAQPRRGLNIIRTADGRTVKVMKK